MHTSLPPGPTRRPVCPPRCLMPVGVAAFSFSSTVHRCYESEPHRNLAAACRRRYSWSYARTEAQVYLDARFTDLRRVGHVVFGGAVVQVASVVEGCHDAGIGSDPHRRGHGVQLRLGAASQFQRRSRSSEISSVSVSVSDTKSVIKCGFAKGEDSPGQKILN